MASSMTIQSTDIPLTQMSQPASENNHDVAPPEDARSQVERWNYPRSNIVKLGFAFLAFMIVGMNDAAVGVSNRISQLALDANTA